VSPNDTRGREGARDILTHIVGCWLAFWKKKFEFKGKFVENQNVTLQRVGGGSAPLSPNDAWVEGGGLK